MPADPRHRLPRPLRRFALPALPALAVLAAACGADSTVPGTGGAKAGGAGTTVPASGAPAPDSLPAAVQAIDISGSEYAFNVQPAGAALVPGWTKVTFHNRGVEAHQVMFARLKPGVDMAALAATAGADSSGSKAIEFVDMLGGVSYIGPGKTIQAMVDLPAGMVMAMCYVPDANGKAHALSGMSTILTVGGAAPGTTGPAATATRAPGATEPVRGTIAMERDGYHLPASMPAGWYRVVNHDGGEKGLGLHEFSLLGLREAIPDDALDGLLDRLARNGDPGVPLDALGGMGALSGGFEAYVYLDLPPGPYLAVDFMPNPGNPRPHLLDGYVEQFRATR